MTPVVRRVDLATARRMAVEAQRLSGPLESSTPRTLLELVRRIRCVQIDPISVVARTQHLVLRSRLARYDPEHLRSLAYHDRALFEYWAHAASYVLTEDWPVHRMTMRELPGWSAWAERMRRWMVEHDRLRRAIVGAIRREGPLRLRDLAERVDASLIRWQESGWSTERNLDQMLRVLWIRGILLVADRRGLERWWDLADRVVPSDVRRQRLSDAGAVRRATELSLRGLGLGTLGHVRDHFTIGRYPGLKDALARLERTGVIERVEVEGMPGVWFVNARDVPALERIAAGEWVPRTTLLSPFDNLIHDRKRAASLFGLDYRVEIYTPKAKRRFGYYTMPVLDGDRFLARIDPAFARADGRLDLKAIHAEGELGRSREVGRRVASAVRELAEWLGADRIEVVGSVPPSWRAAFA